MAEWSIALVLKTSVPKGTVGSNPTSSAKQLEKKYMTDKLKELLETSQIGEPEIVDLIHSYYKLVTAKLFTQEEFNTVLERLGITQNGNVFIFNEDMTYTFN